MKNIDTHKAKLAIVNGSATHFTNKFGRMFKNYVYPSSWSIATNEGELLDVRNYMIGQGFETLKEVYVKGHWYRIKHL